MIIAKNDKRQLITEYGPYMNLRYAIYDNAGTLEVWFSDEKKAKEWWAENHSKETYSEKRERERKEQLEKFKELPEIYEELPFM